MKTCRLCGQDKPLDEFHKHPEYKDGRDARCKTCINARNRETRAIWLSTEKGQESIRAASRKYYYGITGEEFRQLLKDQDYKCAICKISFNETHPFVDHDHSCCPTKKTCGKCVRGLLCNSCNKALGNFQDDLNRVKEAVTYLANGGTRAMAVDPRSS